MATRPTADDAEARVRAAGWEPDEPFPGSFTTPWKLHCTTCGHTVRRPSTPSQVKPCPHPEAARKAKAAEEADEAGHAAWREQIENGTGLDTEIARLTLNDWTPAEPFPGSVNAPWLLRCVRCGHQQRIALVDDLPVCPHPGEATQPPLTQQGHGARRDAYKLLRDDTYTAQARAAGWEPAEPRPARETTPWKLRCTTCEETVLAKVSKGEHETPCPHRLTDAEQATHDRFVEAGWEPVQRPIRGGIKKHWLIRCTTCGYETRREGRKKVTPCTHPNATA